MRKILVKTLMLLVIGLLPAYAMPEMDISANEFDVLVNQLHVKSYKDKEAIIKKIAAIKDPRKVPILQHMQDGELFYRKSDNKIVFRKKSGEQYRIMDVLNDKDMGLVDAGSINKVKVNNKLRRLLRGIIARLSLEDENPEVRQAAVNNIVKNINDSGAALLRESLPKEQDEDVREAMSTGIALMDVLDDDRAVRLKAVAVLSESVLPTAKSRLQDIIEKDEAGNYVESDVELRKLARKGIENIDSRLSVYQFFETAFFGLSLGSVLLLIGVGLAITFGVMGVINMAHGELMMIGAYTTYVVQLMMPNHIDYSLFVAIPLAFVVAGLFGIAIERSVIRFLYGRPLETLLATFGISLILQQMVRSIFSPLNRSVSTPEWMSGSFEINAALSLTYNRFYVIIFSLLVFFFLLALLKKTSLGLQVRAVSQNRPMAKAMGVRSEWVDALTFGLGSGIAGVAGVALSQLTNVGPNLGQTYIIDSFMVVVFGGVGNLWGTLVSAMSLGVFNKFLEPSTGAVLAKILVLVLIILFIQKRPRGMFPQKGRAVEN
jgi:urea transport system permease protein